MQHPRCRVDCQAVPPLTLAADNHIDLQWAARRWHLSWLLM